MKTKWGASIEHRNRQRIRRAFTWNATLGYRTSLRRANLAVRALLRHALRKMKIVENYYDYKQKVQRIRNWTEKRK